MASVNGRIPIRTSADGIMYGSHPAGDYTPPPTAEELAIAAATTAVEAAEQSSLQVDIDAAEPLVDALPVGDVRTTLTARLNLVYVPAHIVLADPGTDNPEFLSPTIAPNNLYGRPGGSNARFMLDQSLEQNSGWSCVHVDANFPGYGNFFKLGAIGDINNDDRYPDGATANSLSVYFRGAYNNGIDNNFTDPSNCVVAINYQENPTIYIIVGGAVVFSITLGLTTPLSFVFRSERIPQRDWLFRLNTGLDLTNHPMPFNIAEALNNFGVDSTGLVEGWGGSGARPAEALATLNITTPPPVDPALGDTIVFNASCLDGNSIDRSSDIYWYNDSMNWHDSAAFGQGDSYSFTPSIIGYYTIRAVYFDASGRSVEDSIIVDVNAEMIHTPETVFNEAASHPNIETISGNQVRFGTATPYKLTALASNSNYNNFAYVEFDLLTFDQNSQFAYGLTTEHNGNVMWANQPNGNYPQDGAGSFSTALLINGRTDRGIWNNGSTAGGFSLPGLYISGSNNGFTFGGTIGFAVDMRDRTTSPTIYVIVLDSETQEPKIMNAFRLPLSYSPLFPMVYANIPSDGSTPFDASINGGASPFVHDPRPALIDIGVEMTGFQYGWTPAETQV